MPNLIFVDENDNPIGAGSGAEARAKNLICRIARIFIFNSQGELLLQKRGPNVPVPNKWDDSVAGHVDEGEDYLTAALRELDEEMGVKGVELTKIATYYTEHFEPAEKSVIGRRFNTLYRTIYDGAIMPNPEEVGDTKWMKPGDIQGWIKERPDDFAYGFIVAFQKYSEADSIGFDFES